MKGSVAIKLLVAILIILIIGAGVLLGMKMSQNQNNTQSEESQKSQNEENNTKPVVPEKKEPKTFKGTDRPIAAMLDNSKDALPHAGLNNAYLVYEIIVEGGESRLMAVFKGANLDRIGPIRSSRHYYLDYALENDAIYVHFGWSPQARDDISSLGVNNINGITESSESFWRDTDEDHAYLHSVATSTADILEIAERKGYETTSAQKSILKYVGEEVNLKSDMIAEEVIIPYSYSNVASFEYDPTTKRYIRYSKGIKETDWTTGETVTTKNIIIVKCANWSLNDEENKGRQTIDNITTLEGYYITNGKAIEITAEKESRESQTVYRDLAGNEIEVNDGNTFIQICPLNSEVEILPGIPEPTPEPTNTVVQ